MRLIGLDYGSARIGIALGDTVTKVASPWKIMINDSFEDTVQRLQELMKHEKAEALVVGVPRPLGDQSRVTDQAQEILTFAGKLREAGFVVHEWDETLTSKVAADQQKEMGARGKRDDLAAAAILQNYLDALPA
ncbi:Holliday junction resolvase RuvX [Candidatus Uhrbacteria bacterium]|nr:Holliday junction resolvase RuvX [Candidatus Uhrbacteria bacterium]